MHASTRRGLYLLRYGTYVPTELYVNHDLKLVYISIPKAACTSIQAALAENAHGLVMRRRPRRSESDYLTFTFVRDPFDRLVSCYRDKVLRFQPHVGRYHFDTRYNNFFMRKAFGVAVTTGMPFAEFADFVAKIPDRFSDPHFKSQWSIIRDSRCRRIDFTGRFERLEGDSDELVRRHGLGKLPHANAGGERVGLDEYYSDRSVLDLVAERYKRDIETWGYHRTYDALLESLNRSE